MAAFFGFVLALMLFSHFKRQSRYYRRRWELEDEDFRAHVRRGSSGAEEAEDNESGSRDPTMPDWSRDWDWRWGYKPRGRRSSMRHRGSRSRDGSGRGGSRKRRRGSGRDGERAESSEGAILRRAKSRAHAELGFYSHLMSYLGVMAMLALINIFTTRYPWFLWPAMGWGIGLFAHYMAVFGSQKINTICNKTRCF